MTEKPQKPTDPTPPATPAEARERWPKKKEEAVALANQLEAGVTPDNYRQAIALSKTLASETAPLVREAMTQSEDAQHCGEHESMTVKVFKKGMDGQLAKLDYILPRQEQERAVNACEAAMDKTGKMEGLCQPILREHALIGLYASAKNGQFFADIHDCLSGDLPSGTGQKAKPKEPSQRKP